MNIIYHLPLPLNHNPSGASGIRPIKMLNAFKELGLNVDEATGDAKARSQAVRTIKEKIRTGHKYHFLYSESSTMPTLLTAHHHLPTNPTLDFSLFKACKESAIPTTLFYRDIYWQFEEYKKKMHPIKGTIAKLFYKYDIYQYNKLLSRLYLPSLEMSHYLPGKKKYQVDKLPPGHDLPTIGETKPDNHLRLLYIGGIGPHYKMHELFRAMGNLPNARLTICTRENEWKSTRSEYRALNALNNVNVVHLCGTQLKDLYDNHDLCTIFVEPHEYRTFTAPMKLYEYIGHGKPIVASANTLVGDTVQGENLGWTIPYEHKRFVELVMNIIKTPKLLREKVEEINFIRAEHTWEARARKVIKDCS